MISIYGAGMAGLLAAHMLRRFAPVVYESQKSLPNNHEALLRFRTDAVSKATGIPFRKVSVSKAICSYGKLHTTSNIALENQYSLKVTGEYHQRSIADLRPVERYVAPPNFISQMARSLGKIEYGVALTEHCLGGDDAKISTIPMPALMRILDWPELPEFKFKTIWTYQATITAPSCDLYQTIYYPEPQLPYYRASLTGNRLIIEFAKEVPAGELSNLVTSILVDFGIGWCNLDNETGLKSHRYGKLLPIDNSARRQFILAATDQHRIYSIGRFSTWRQILMDDVVQDVARVEAMIDDRSAYAFRLAHIKEHGK